MSTMKSETIQRNRELLAAKSSDEVMAIVRQQGEEFRQPNLATALEALGKLGGAPQSRDLATLLQKVLVNLQEKPADWKGPSLAKTAWALGRLSTDDASAASRATKLLLGVLARSHLVSLAPSLNATCIADLAWAYAAARVDAEDLFGSLIHESKPRLSEFSPQNLVTLSWALSHAPASSFGDARRRSLFYAALARELRPKVSAMPPASLVKLACGFSDVGHLYASISLKFLEILNSTVQYKIKNFGWKNLARLAAAYDKQGDDEKSDLLLAAGAKVKDAIRREVRADSAKGLDEMAPCDLAVLAETSRDDDGFLRALARGVKPRIDAFGLVDAASLAAAIAEKGHSSLMLALGRRAESLLVADGTTAPTEAVAALAWALSPNLGDFPSVKEAALKATPTTPTDIARLSVALFSTDARSRLAAACLERLPEFGERNVVLAIKAFFGEPKVGERALLEALLLRANGLQEAELETLQKAAVFFEVDGSAIAMALERSRVHPSGRLELEMGGEADFADFFSHANSPKFASDDAEDDDEATTPNAAPAKKRNRGTRTPKPRGGRRR